jgi:hypothetical protein
MITTLDTSCSENTMVCQQGEGFCMHVFSSICNICNICNLLSTLYVIYVTFYPPREMQIVAILRRKLSPNSVFSSPAQAVETLFSRAGWLTPATCTTQCDLTSIFYPSIFETNYFVLPYTRHIYKKNTRRFFLEVVSLFTPIMHKVTLCDR